MTSDNPTMGFSLAQDQIANKAMYQNGQDIEMKHGDVVIAAITSCTNTSNPSVGVRSWYCCQEAVERGLKVPAYVKP